MKKLYTILLITFVTINLFGQSGYKLDPGKLNIWSNNNAIAGNGFPAGRLYLGIENLVTLNGSPNLSYDKITGIQNTVTNNSATALGTTYGIESNVTSLDTPISIFAVATGPNSTGIEGRANPTNATENGNYRGVTGTIYAYGSNSPTLYGVTGNAFSSGNTAYNYGVYGVAGGSGSGATNYGVYGTTSYTNSTSFAGYFQGKVHVNGTLSKSAGTFKIDHPLDPLNKYLSHSFVESPDMMNIYNGNIITDANGRATVNLPNYFEALNMDFRYQLTVIGAFSQAIVMEEIQSNKFIVATDKPNIKVSWQVTGVRNDVYAKKNRVVPEQDKPDSEKGKYLNADAFGLQREESLHSVKLAEETKKREEALQNGTSKEVIKK